LAARFKAGSVDDGEAGAGSRGMSGGVFGWYCIGAGLNGSFCMVAYCFGRSTVVKLN
jgi:hypothetical protein